MSRDTVYHDPTFQAAARNLERWLKGKKAHRSRAHESTQENPWMTTASNTEKAAAILADRDGTDSETQPISKERIMKDVISVPAPTDKDWNGHTVTGPTGKPIDADELLMQILCNADNPEGFRNRARYIITAVR